MAMGHSEEQGADLLESPHTGVSLQQEVVDGFLSQLAALQVEVRFGYWVDFKSCMKGCFFIVELPLH